MDHEYDFYSNIPIGSKRWVIVAFKAFERCHKLFLSDYQNLTFMVKKQDYLLAKKINKI